MRLHHRLHARALRLRESVIARLLLTLVLALGAVGTFQYFVVGQRVESDLIREHAAVHAADARSLEQRAEETEGNRYEQPLSEVTELMAAIQARPDTLDVVVTEQDGTVLASPVAGQVGIERYRPAAAARSRGPAGRSRASPAGTSHNAYIVPLQLLDRDLVFAEYRSSGRAEVGRRLVPRQRRHVRAAQPADRAAALLRARRPPGGRALPGRAPALPPQRPDRPRQPPRLPGRARPRGRRDHALRGGGTLALLDIDDFKFEKTDTATSRRPPAVRAGRAAARGSAPATAPSGSAATSSRCCSRHTNECDADIPLERIRAAVERRLSGVTTSIGFSAARTDDREPSSLWGAPTPPCSRPSAAAATRSSPPPRSPTASRS